MAIVLRTERGVAATQGDRRAGGDRGRGGAFNGHTWHAVVVCKVADGVGLSAGRRSPPEKRRWCQRARPTRCVNGGKRQIPSTSPDPRTPVRAQVRGGNPQTLPSAPGKSRANGGGRGGGGVQRHRRKASEKKAINRRVVHGLDDGKLVCQRQ